MKIRAYIDHLPIIATTLIGYGNVGQLYKMWAHHTAAGQNFWSYVSISFALVCWTIYYGEKIGKTSAYYITILENCIVILNALTVFHFQGLK